MLCVLFTAGTQAAPAQPHKLLVLGDSLSAGYGLRQQDGWVSLLQEHLSEASYELTVINASISGETTSGGLRRLPDLLNRHQPKIVIIELGGNDALRGQPLGGIRQRLTQIIELSQAAGAEVLLTGMHIPPNYGPRYTAGFHAIYQQLAEQRELAFVPFLLEGVATRPEWMQSDGIHPKAEAQASILQNVLPALQPLIRPFASDSARAPPSQHVQFP